MSKHTTLKERAQERIQDGHPGRMRLGIATLIIESSSGRAVVAASRTIPQHSQSDLRERKL